MVTKVKSLLLTLASQRAVNPQDPSTPQALISKTKKKTIWDSSLHTLHLHSQHHAFSPEVCSRCPRQRHWCLWGKAIMGDSPRAGQSSVASPQHPRSKHLSIRKLSRAASQVGSQYLLSLLAAASHCCHSPLPPGVVMRLRLSLLECLARTQLPISHLLPGHWPYSIAADLQVDHFIIVF